MEEKPFGSFEFENNTEHRWEIKDREINKA